MTEQTSKPKCGVVGLGYVGLNLAYLFTDAGYPTVGYDIDQQKISALKAGHDPTGEFEDNTFSDRPIEFTSSPAAIGDCAFVFIAVPSPLDEELSPDLSSLKMASESVGEHLSEDAVVVYESTLYPGAIREELRPAIRAGARRQDDASFSVGYSPERIVPGADTKGASDITKLVSAEDDATRDKLQALFEDVIDGDVYPTDTIEIAEAAKCLENTQRDVNIALINEFAMGANALEFDLDPYAVLEAAGTKWAFHEYRPGIVGGHCIPVDPHYLRDKFESAGYEPQLLSSARTVNEQMRTHVAEVTIDALKSGQEPTPPQQEGFLRGDGSGHLPNTRVLLLGLSYKPNVADLRNSPAFGVSETLQDHGIEVVGYDPLDDEGVAPETFDFDIQPELDVRGFDGLVVLTPHDELLSMDLEGVADQMSTNPVFVDVGNAFETSTVTAAGFHYQRP